VARIASEAGFDGPLLVRAAGASETKEALKGATSEAVARGVFGVPTMVVDGELFWGVDALESLEDFLAGRDPLAKTSLAQWASLPASAKRRGA
jgi:2-hydroxychromene-2-carboxylate isomerase